MTATTAQAVSVPASAQQQLLSSVKRLERLLGGGSNGGTTTATSTLTATSTAGKNNASSSPKTVVEAATTMIHSNPCKIVKRWLSTSSGIRTSMMSTSSTTTCGGTRSDNALSLADVALTAQMVLNPDDDTCTGTSTARDILIQLAPPPPPHEDAAMDTTTTTCTDTSKDDKSSSSNTYLVVASREVEAYLFSLAIRILYTQQNTSSYQRALELSKQAIHIVTTYIEQSQSLSYYAATATASSGNVVTGLYPLLARLYRYQALVAETLQGSAGSTGTSTRSTITTSTNTTVGTREQLVHAHRMAVMRRDYDTQATLLNIMLRDLLQADQVEQAQKLLANSSFPESASNNQLCRYLYYSGRIQALRLEYTSAFSNLSTCLRKAPTNTALGFRIAVQRLLIVVQLLMGEIPSRDVFYTPDMKGELSPYLKITQAVRRGDLAVFKETVTQFTQRLKLDGTYTLISRLVHSVVKAGLRRLNTSYSRISLQDIASRLGLTNATSAEFVVSKAVRDGVIDATIYHEEGYVQSHDLVDVYATVEPMEAFHRRIAYCLTTHNDAVRGMRYPPDEYKKQLEASRGMMRGKKEDTEELEDDLDGDY